MRKKIICLLCLIVLGLASSNIYAANYVYCTEADYASGAHGCKDTYVSASGTKNCSDTDYRAGVNGCRNKYEYYNASAWWEAAGGFLSDYHGSNTTIGSTTIGSITSFLDPLVDLVKVVGNMIFVIVTVVLGVKYIWGGVESKASVKDSLMTLIVAALVFYGWNTISALFMTGNQLSFIGSTVEDTSLKIYSTILYICNFLAVGGIVYIGIRYMMAGAEGKAQLKVKGVPVVLGIIMVYATITFLNFIVGLI